MTIQNSHIENRWYRPKTYGLNQNNMGFIPKIGMLNPISDGLSWTLLKYIHGDQKVHSAQLALKSECNLKLAIALTIMEECFLPMHLIHGVKVAEMPLIVTCSKYRRQGLCRRLINNQSFVWLQKQYHSIEILGHLFRERFFFNFKKELISHANQHMDQQWLMKWLLQLADGKWFSGQFITKLTFDSLGY
ncbi:Acyl-CoA N-acyltransferase [Artemisia annua]|uniref:Acyl-CoA N-acyltransferase n=1 Tax=Artemisia annua TaxID=35608 RepID=A0A2U1PML6_ARTAN|nr:Acyl-CoA N-acyltransferase [Artemisia annua]